MSDARGDDGKGKGAAGAVKYIVAAILAVAPAAGWSLWWEQALAKPVVAAVLTVGYYIVLDSRHHRLRQRL